MRLDRQTTLFCPVKNAKPVEYALAALGRDLADILGTPPAVADRPAANQIRIALGDVGEAESFSVRHRADESFIQITGRDELGAVFGIYHVCEHILGIDPFQFWTDFPVSRKDEINVAPFDYASPKPRVRFRSWFTNGEDLLTGWHDDLKISLKTWESIFETMLRAGFNMVIPGTGIWAGDPQLQLAADMGLWITHHHAEPLGARLFANAYDGAIPKYPEDLDRVAALYREAIEINRGRKVVWGLGIRCQGDGPVWVDDPRHEAPEAAGKLIGEMIRLQKKLIAEHAPGPHYWVHNIFGESSMLYRRGLLDLDDDVIRVWGDNGYGAMRQRGHRGVDPVLPPTEDGARTHGVYYHVNYHDLTSSNQLVPLVRPELIEREFDRLYEAGDIQYAVINVGNIRPHVFDIQLIGKVLSWSADQRKASGGVVAAHYRDFNAAHFPGFETEVAHLMRRYYEAPFQWGPFEDQRAGEQTYHHMIQSGVHAAMNKDVEKAYLEFFGSVFAEPGHDLRYYFSWLKERAAASLPGWKSLYGDSEALSLRMLGGTERYFSDSVRTHIAYMYCSCAGFVAGMEGLLSYLDKDYRNAFISFGQGKVFMEQAWRTLQAGEHGKWINYYRGEWLTGTRETVRKLRTMMGVCKELGDEGGSFRSVWALDCMKPTKVAMSILQQVKPDYDAIAAGLLKLRRQEEAVRDDFSILI